MIVFKWISGKTKVSKSILMLSVRRVTGRIKPAIRSHRDVFHHFNFIFITTRDPSVYFYQHVVTAYVHFTRALFRYDVRCDKCMQNHPESLKKKRVIFKQTER